MSRALVEGRPKDAHADLDRLVQIFGRESTYVEIQNAGLAEQQQVNPGLIALADETRLPLVATRDVHYLDADDAVAHEGPPLHPVGRHAQEPKPLEVRHQRILLQAARAHDRLRFELKTIKKMGFADYFLIALDFIHFAKQNGVSIGPGCGSAASSLAAYCLEISRSDAYGGEIELV